MSEDNVFSMLCRPVRRLLNERGFGKPTQPQSRLIPHILERKNVLLISPTATGKTEAAMLPILHLHLMSERRPGISIIYITPLRALNRDILDRMTYWCSSLDIRLAVRHGDTTTRERNRQRQSPPEMLITTPETLQAILSGRVLRRFLKTVKWVVVDEIHELADNKRGSQLSIALERVRELADEEFQMIGLSATIGSPEKVGQFLVGNGRDVEIVQVSATRDTTFEIVYPEPEPDDYDLATKLFTHPEVASRLAVMKELIEGHETTLIFTNTRSTSEMLASRFNIWDIDFPLSIHHGSLAKTSRIAAEKGLKMGDLRTVVCTSSLELGIDIGSIDLVIQYNSPRQVTRLLQRVGRSGHSVGERAKGVIIALNSDDALESMVICRRALKEIMEPLVVPQKPYDVLVNQIVAEFMSKSRLYFLQAKNLFSRAYPYEGLTEDEIKFVAKYMHNRFPRLAWVSEEDEVIIRPRGNRKTIYRYFFDNLSMIPDEKTYLVIDVSEETAVGILQEAFVAEYAKPGVKFVIRGRPWKILNVHNDKIYVRAEDDPEGSIPTWVGEEIPVPLDVALEVGAIKGQVEEGVIAGLAEDNMVKSLVEAYPARRETIKRAISEVIEHVESGFPVPTNRRVVVEDWGENVIIHASFGTLVNRTLARLVGHIVSEETGYPVGVQQDTYNVVTQTVGEVDASYVMALLKRLAEADLEGLMQDAITKTGLFKSRLINVARKSGALSKYANFSNITLGRLMKSFEGTCIFEEAMKDTLRKDLDMETTMGILQKIADGEIEVVKIETGGEVSPLAQVAIDGISMKADIVPAEKMTRIIIESARARLLSESRVLACLGKRDHVDTYRIKELPEKLACPRCGSTELGVFDRSKEEVSRELSRERPGVKREAERWWERGRDTAKLVSMYGRRGAIVATARRVDFTDAWDILAETEGESDKFFERIVEAERDALKKRFI
ncbi:MAG: DEAD/DEAH box helicase [Candidatus Bathyarchaeota archaeon]|nr:MAG: DEAD/DEAH box helicase [Candidatus Bathyarchaeota archaeon]